MKKIFTSIIFLLAFSISFTGCSTKSSLTEKDTIREIAYNWIDDNKKSTIIDWKTSKVEKITFDKEHLVVNETETLDIINKEAFKVTFTTKDDDLLGPVIVYLDTDTSEVLGMDFRE